MKSKLLSRPGKGKTKFRITNRMVKTNDGFTKPDPIKPKEKTNEKND